MENTFLIKYHHLLLWLVCYYSGWCTRESSSDGNTSNINRSHDRVSTSSLTVWRWKPCKHCEFVILVRSLFWSSAASSADLECTVPQIWQAWCKAIILLGFQGILALIILPLYCEFTVPQWQSWFVILQNYALKRLHNIVGVLIVETHTTCFEPGSISHHTMIFKHFLWSTTMYQSVQERSLSCTDVQC